jgi:hypothetical protein
MINMTMTTMIKRGCVIILLFMAALPGLAQDKDFGVWYGVSTSKGITYKFDLELSGMLRTFNNASQVDQGFFEAGLKYKINKNLSAAFSYRIIDAVEDNDKYYAQHKFFLDLSGDVKLSAFQLSGRFRFQTRIKTYLEYYTDKFPDYTGRIKGKVTYRTPSFPVNPYISYEAFCPMFVTSDRVIGKQRFSLGIQYKTPKKHTIDIGYIRQRDFLPHISDINILSLSYDFKL